jgi:hypothetical protein
MVLLAIGGLAPWVLQWTAFQQTTYFLATTVVATLWWMQRRRKASTQPNNTYGPLVRGLHWLALEPAVVRHLAFDLERQFFLPKRNSVPSTVSTAADPADGAVYVCGLARSGTTMLLRILDEIDDFRSLTYRDMPFVLAPNLWKKITKFAPQPAAPVERAHGDGIEVGFDSPEGFEEVFWRTYSTSHANERCLSAVTPPAEALSAFDAYRAIVANPRTEPIPPNGKPRRYLSKNNNNLLRLRSLCADPTATVLLVYRDPIATARSLHRQHQRFCVAQTNDRFTQTYMRWLAHHEFGLDHRAFSFAVPAMDGALTPEDPNYWLDYWCAVYGHVLSQQDLRLHLVNHDAICADPPGMIERVFAVLGVNSDTNLLARQIAPPPPEAGKIEGFRNNLHHRAEAIHSALLASPLNIRHTMSAVQK